jgi:hypothetical protein
MSRLIVMMAGPGARGPCAVHTESNGITIQEFENKEKRQK